MRSSSSPKVMTPHPSTAVGIAPGSTSAAAAISSLMVCWHGCVGSR